MTNQKNKLIAKNTVFLYTRMLLIMGVSLYTSRFILDALGVVDFGIYNVVGGVVVMFSFLSASMSSATQRFISFELGKRDYSQLRKVFSMSINIHIIVAILILILAESIGLWFLNYKMVIPEDRMVAANWVYQFSLLSFMVNILSVPYIAVIIAYERMKIYAYLSILEVLMKLIIAFSLFWIDFDELKIYAILIFCVSVVTWLVYRIYSKRNFSITNYFFNWDFILFKTLMSFAGWNLFGSMAGVTMGQGVNILLNLYFGPAVNAARSIAYQVKGAVNGFVLNFQMAMNPQIVKSYAEGNLKYMHEIIFQGSKFSFFLLYIFSLPLILEAKIVLEIWLTIVPDYTVIFLRLALLNVLIDSLSGTLMTSAQASGKIKRYQGIVGGLLLMILPISYFFLEMGYPPQITFAVSILISIIGLFTRLYIINHLVGLSIKKFTKRVIGPVLGVAVASCILPIIIKVNIIDHEMIRLFVVVITSFFSVICLIYLMGLNKNEQVFLKMKLQKVVFKDK